MSNSACISLIESVSLTEARKRTLPRGVTLTSPELTNLKKATLQLQEQLGRLMHHHPATLRLPEALPTHTEATMLLQNAAPGTSAYSRPSTRQLPHSFLWPEHAALLAMMKLQLLQLLLVLLIQCFHH